MPTRSSLESFLTRAWMWRGILACSLWPVSQIFRVLTVLRRTLYQAGILKSTRIAVPVIIVGNLFVGGTGKTPFTIWLVEQLRRAGFTPGVISRGYGRRQDAPSVVTSDSEPEQVGDEPVLIAQRTKCPIVVGRSRVAAAQALLTAYPHVNLIISDDGLQHYALQRDIEIVLCDARGNGNGWMLPAGPLREPPSRRRDFTVMNAEKTPVGIPANAIRMRLVGETAQQLTDCTHSIALTTLSSRKREGAPSLRIVAAAGIGNPARFFAMLREHGLEFEELPLPDHYNFAANPFADVQADIILMTEKDAVKCMQFDTLKNDPRLWIVPVSACIDETLAEQIVEKCRGRSTA